MVNNLEGYAEYAVQKKLKAKDRMPVVASAALMVVGLAIWTFIAGWVGPSILIMLPWLLFIRCVFVKSR